MIIIKPLSQCSFSDALEAFNKGFEDYYLPIELSLDQFTCRFGFDQLSVDHSFMAFYNNTPAGIMLNGIKKVKGKKTCLEWRYKRSPTLPKNGNWRRLTKSYT
ncbi:hypothetical protein [Priestia megaterium]|uniref:hypothetical protein n=1 Tax=Priestia megaterium TaxID=1404 RepID=UPI001F207078|nr:hypothetical protein [Priestia megaterium]